MQSIAILGAGCGGNAMAADLSLAGFEVHLAECLNLHGILT
jgi:predicted NAD/FAD-dependent oxidoreductase